MLDPRYTFKTFVSGPFNHFAHAAALAVSLTPGEKYNPLCISGGKGLGKTHLLHALGAAIIEKSQEARVVYVASDRFVAEFTNAVRFNKRQDLRSKYRDVDVFLLDDLHLLAGKGRTQEEIFHTFNALHDAHKQIVATSSHSPRDVDGLQERLKSRFEWGLVADIQPPDLEAKVAILERKAKLARLRMPAAVSELIASRLTDIREIETATVRLAALVSMRTRPPDIESALEVLEGLRRESKRKITIEHIKEVVAHHYGVSAGDLDSRNNTPSVALPRQVAMYLSKECTPASLSAIGQSFAGKHHSTVVHAIKKISNLRAENDDFHKLINRLVHSIKKV